MSLEIRPATDAGDRSWLRGLWRREWSGETMVTRGRLHRLDELEAVIAWDDGERVGAATYRIEGEACELTSLNALHPSLGIGTHLLAAVEEAAGQRGATRTWLVTTNDNLEAQRFYERRGYRLAALHEGAIEESRRLKPSIPQVGRHGIPLRDELVYEKLL